MEELREFFKIKEKLFKLSPNVGGCCSVFSLSGELLRQVEVLEWVLQAFEQDNRGGAVNKLEWFEENCMLPEDEEEVKKLEAELGESPEDGEQNYFVNRSRMFLV